MGGRVSFTLSLAHYINKIYPSLAFMAAFARTTPEKVFSQPSCALLCAALLYPHCGRRAGLCLFYPWGTPSQTAKLSNPGLCSTDASGPTLLSDSGCLISTPDRSSGTSADSQIKAQLVRAGPLTSPAPWACLPSSFYSRRMRSPAEMLPC